MEGTKEATTAAIKKAVAIGKETIEVVMEGAKEAATVVMEGNFLNCSTRILGSMKEPLWFLLQYYTLVICSLEVIC